MFRPTHGRAPRRPLLAASAALGAALIAAPAATAADPAFYQPPSTLPAENGAIVKTAPMQLGASVALPVLRPLPGKATKIMYKSTDSNGLPVAVTGTYIEPTLPWTGGGRARPLVSFAEGTQGQGDECAPSRTLETPIAVRSGSLALGYEVPFIYGLLTKGIGVVVTDYVGLGTPGRLHTYVNRVDQGNAVLDAARAALKVPGASVNAQSPVGVYGYSQGGGAAASAAELAPTYAPELPIKGAYAGAPPADLHSVIRGADGTVLTAVIGYAINGFIESYPSLKPILEANTNSAGLSALRTISGQCTADSIAAFAYRKTNQWSRSGLSLGTIVKSIPEVSAVVDEQRIGRRKPNVPVLVTGGTRDDIVPHGQVKQLALDWCRLGARVDYRPTVQYFDTFGTSINHLGPAVLGNAGALGWMVDRLAGGAPPSNCARVPRLP